ncbi:MAG: deoxycytidine deaminase [Candidatus Moranbacteria bacterium]|jgi:dCTP deaminase|nr:deoxycytidine deaminase [Candidatus Moranbacteria bacterium]
MILTGSKIKEEINAGNIVIKPFSENQVNPNSYNYRLGSAIKVFNRFDGKKALFKEINIPEDGYVLEPRKMYLATTKEVIGSSKYAMSLIGRSSMGRYGLFLQVSANLGHTTSEHRWTLEIVAALPIRLYPGMIIGQVSFWNNFGTVKKYDGRYGRLNHPQESYVPLIQRQNI